MGNVFPKAPRRGPQPSHAVVFTVNSLERFSGRQIFPPKLLEAALVSSGKHVAAKSEMGLIFDSFKAAVLSLSSR